LLTARGDPGRQCGPGPDTISLPAGTHSLSITGAGEDNAASGDLDITEALTITGAGPDATVIEASGLADRIFHSTCPLFSRKLTEKIYSPPASENFPEDPAARPAVLPAFGE
jgi:hypothetical protein